MFIIYRSDSPLEQALVNQGSYKTYTHYHFLHLINYRISALMLGWYHTVKNNSNRWLDLYRISKGISKFGCQSNWWESPEKYRRKSEMEAVLWKIQGGFGRLQLWNTAQGWCWRRQQTRKSHVSYQNSILLYRGGKK